MMTSKALLYMMLFGLSDATECSLINDRCLPLYITYSQDHRLTWFSINMTSIKVMHYCLNQKRLDYWCACKSSHSLKRSHRVKIK